MAKTPRTSKAKAAAQAAAKPTELQHPSGAEAKPSAAAATEGEAEAKATEGQATVAVDPAGAETGSAPASEQSRDAADVPATDRKAGADEGNQPEVTHQPPVAEDKPEGDPLGDGSDYGVRPISDEEGPAGDLADVLVASVSPTGRRRAGQGFGPEPVRLRVSDATLALLEGDPQLIVKRG